MSLDDGNIEAAPRVRSRVRARAWTPVWTSLWTVTLCLLGGCRAEPSRPSAEPSAEAAPLAGTASCPAAIEDEARAALDAAGHAGVVIVIDLAREKEIAAVYEGIEPDHAVHPASTVKPFLAATALERGVLKADDEITCAGSWERDGAKLHCFAEHGPIDLRTALATSCNAYFYEVAFRLGREGVVDAFRRFGLDEVVAAAESAPDLAHLITIAIGHGEARVTPRALAHAHARLARERGPELGPVHAGLRDVVGSEAGTGKAAAAPGLDVAGKTGTSDGEARGLFHAWFAGYAPAASPQVLVLAYLDADGGGGPEAAPVAGRVFGAWRDHCAAPAPATLGP